jgi:hypothetical protein
MTDDLIESVVVAYLDHLDSGGARQPDPAGETRQPDIAGRTDQSNAAGDTEQSDIAGPTGQSDIAGSTGESDIARRTGQSDTGGVADHLGVTGDLSVADRAYAAALVDGLAAARGIDPNRRRPPLEALLAGTPLAGLFPDRLLGVEEVLAGIDHRARVSRDNTGVIFEYLDLRARFVLDPDRGDAGADPSRELARRIFADDPDTSRIGIVAGQTAELTTLVVSPQDVGDAIGPASPEPALPLALAARRLVEQSAPVWPAYAVDRATLEPFDVAAVAAQIARRVLSREVARAYRGEKRLAYRALADQAEVFAALAVRVSTPGEPADLHRELDRIVAGVLP